MVTTVFVPRSGHRPLTLILVLVCVALAVEARAPVMEKAVSHKNESEIAADKEVAHSEIIVLPKVVVRPAGSPIFGEHEIFSQSGLDELLRKRFPGASFKGQPVGLDNYAKLMYADVKREESLRHYQDLARTLREAGDVAGGKELRSEILPSVYPATFLAGRSDGSKSE